MRKSLRSIFQMLHLDTEMSGAQPSKRALKRKLNEKLINLLNKDSGKRCKTHVAKTSVDSTTKYITVTNQSDTSLTQPPTPPSKDSTVVPSRIPLNNAAGETSVVQSTVKVVSDSTSPLSQLETEHKSSPPQPSTTPPPHIVVDATRLADLPGNSTFADQETLTNIEQESSHTGDTKSSAHNLTEMGVSASRPTSTLAAAEINAEENTHLENNYLEGSIKSPKRHQRDKSGDSGYKSGRGSRTPTPPETNREALAAVPEDDAVRLSREEADISLPAIPVPGCDTGPRRGIIGEQKGRMRWVLGSLSRPEPEWTMELQVDAIKPILAPYLYLINISEDDLVVEFFAQGMWNKLFEVRSANGQAGSSQEYIFRASLPVMPWYKVECEVATLEYVRERTTIPVPKVYAYDSTTNNAISYEWILMDKMQGKSYNEVEATMEFEQKTSVIRTVADWMHQLSTLRFSQIGSLYRLRNEILSSDSGFRLGPVVHQNFMPDWRAEYRFYRGPFKTIDQYLRSLVDVVLKEIADPRQKCRAELEALMDELEALEEEGYAGKGITGLPDEAETEQSNAIEGIKQRILALRPSDGDNDIVLWDESRWKVRNWKGEPAHDFTEIPKVCDVVSSIMPSICQQQCLGKESTCLYHWDISENNVLVDGSGRAVALVDWEQIITLPSCLMDPYPSLIAGNDVLKPSIWTRPGPKDSTRLANEREYERTLLRKEFKKRLQELKSPWLETFKEKDDDFEELCSLISSERYLGCEPWDLVSKTEGKLGWGLCTLS